MKKIIGLMFAACLVFSAPAAAKVCKKPINVNQPIAGNSTHLIGGDMIVTGCDVKYMYYIRDGYNVNYPFVLNAVKSNFTHDAIGKAIMRDTHSFVIYWFDQRGFLLHRGVIK